VVIESPETGDNFNLSNSTRALEFHPRSLLNSTSEREHEGYRNQMFLQKEGNHFGEGTPDVHHPSGSRSYAVDFFNRFNNPDPQKYV